VAVYICVYRIEVEKSSIRSIQMHPKWILNIQTQALIVCVRWEYSA